MNIFSANSVKTAAVILFALATGWLAYGPQQLTASDVASQSRGGLLKKCTGTEPSVPCGNTTCGGKTSCKNNPDGSSNCNPKDDYCYFADTPGCADKVEGGYCGV